MKNIIKREIKNITDNINFTIDEAGYLFGTPEWNFVNTANVRENKLYCITRGKAYVKTQNKEYTLTEGNIYLLCADRMWEYRCDGEFEKLYFHFNCEVYNSLDLFKGLNDVFELKDTDGITDKMKKLFYSDSYADFLLLENILQNIVLKFVDKTGSRLNKYCDLGKKYKDIFEYTEKHLSSKLTAAQICKLTGRREATVNANFKRDTGMTVNRYIKKCIYNRVCRELLYSTLHVNEISEKYEFSDPYYFSNWFKKISLMSPYNYKRKYKKQ